MKVAILGPADLHVLRWPLGEPPGLPPTYSAPIVSHLANALMARGHQVLVATCSEAVRAPVTYRSGPLTVVVVRRRPRHRARDFFAIERAGLTAALRRHPCDVVHAQWTYEFAWAALASGLPTVVSVRDDATLVLRLSPDPYRLVRWLMDRHTLAAAPLLVANSRYLRDRLPRVARGKTVVVPNMCGPLPVTPVDPARRRPLTIVTVSNGFSRRKNIAAALEAVALVRASIPSLHYRLIGEGLGADGPAARYARAHGLAEAVSFVGPLSYREALAEIAGASLYLHPATEESFGMTVLEAMLLGTPVVAGRHSGNVPDLLGGGRQGYLCDVTSPSDIAATVTAALRDPRAAAARAARASREARLLYTPEAVAPLWEAVYEHVCANWPPARARRG